MERAELKTLALGTGCACERAGAVFLCDPHWGEAERSQATALRAQHPAGGVDRGWLCIATGGTSGGIRYVRHDEHTVHAAVEGFRSHFGAQRINALGVLPAFHISGFMARARCAATGGVFLDWSWKRLETGEWPCAVADGGDWFLSLVPTQLQRLLGSERAISRLREFRAVFIGGGPLWPELADRAAELHIPIVASYGMTETAAMIASQLASDFQEGDRSSGRVMPHAKVEIIDDVTGESVLPDEVGLVRIRAASVYRGYWPAVAPDSPFVTEDLGSLDVKGRLRIVGRRDAVVISGGKKIHPAEVEAVLRASGQFGDVGVIGIPDPEWGHAVVACFPQAGGQPDRGKVEAALAVLAPYKRPKRYLAIADWPRNAQGKLSRVALARAAAASSSEGAPTTPR